MPKRRTIMLARRDKARGRSASVQAGEFVREEIHKIRAGRHGARSPEQAIAIGLSEARRAGVDLPPPGRGKASERTRAGSRAAYDAGQGRPHGRPSPRRAAASRRTLEREGTSAASTGALSRHARAAASRRTASERSASARRGSATKGPAERRGAAPKAARTRARS